MAAADPSNRRPTVLVADDDPDVRAVARTCLALLGCATVVVAGGLDALAAFVLNPHTFGLLLLDVEMPGLDGPATLDALRAAGLMAPCWFMTGGSARYTLPELLTRGAAGVLLKPFGLTELARMLAAAPGPPSAPSG